MRTSRNIPLVLGLCLVSAAAWAGGGPQQVLIVVNDASVDSVELGHTYQHLRGIPQVQLLHVLTSTNDQISSVTFTNEILQPIRTYLADSGLSNQVEYLVLSSDIPSRVAQGNSTNSITSALFYGFKTYGWPPICTLPAGTDHAYFAAEAAFQREEFLPESLGLCSLLKAFNRKEANTLVQRAVSADATQPTGTVFFLHSTDISRNVQWPQFENADFLARFTAGPQQRVIRDANLIENETNVMGVVLGVTGINPRGRLYSNTFVPGAIADHLTSFGGRFGDILQMKILEWIRSGCAGSYGTVTEPCAYTNKFPQARLHYWYARGFNMAESYYMAVENPYMGIVVGDPLCQPYARPPRVEVSGLASNSVVASDVTISVTGTALSAQQRVRRLHLLLDDRPWLVLTNCAPAAGAVVSATVDGTTRSYTVQSGDSLAAVATGLAGELNANPPLVPAVAEAVSDRVLLVQKAKGVPGTDLEYGAEVSPVSAAGISASAAGAFFLESTAPARQEARLTGVAQSGDVVRVTLTPLGGSPLTHSVTAGVSDTATTLLSALRNAVNADPLLQGPEGCEAKYPNLVEGSVHNATLQWVARTNGWPGYNLLAEFEATGANIATFSPAAPFDDNENVITARGMIFLSAGEPVLTGDALIPVSGLADGPHVLRAVATEGSAVASQGHLVIPFRVDRIPMDCRLEEPYTADPYLWGQTFIMRPVITGAVGSVTSVSFYVEGKLAAVQTAPPFSHTVDTALYGAGRIDLQARAKSDAGEEAWSEVEQARVLRVADEDADGLPDGWEDFYFGDTNVIAAADDPDGDGQNCHAEFITGTNPDDPDHFFRSVGFDVPVVDELARVTFVSTPTRRYAVQWRQPNMLEENPWQPADPEFFPGAPGQTTWTDTNFPARPLAPPIAGWRVRVALP